MLAGLISKIRTRISEWLQQQHKARRAREDFHNARGYKHRSKLKQLRERLLRKISEHEDVLSELQLKLQRSIDELDGHARREAFRQLMEEQLSQVRGVGEAIAGRIIESPHIKDPDSFSRHVTSLEGIGKKKGSNLITWVTQLDPELERRKEKLKESSQFAEERKALIDLQKEIAGEEERINQLESLLSEVDSELEELNGISPQDLIDARTSEGKLSRSKRRRIEKLFRGIYAAWETPPDWLKRLLSEVGI